MDTPAAQVRYRQQYIRCGKATCRNCAAGPGHGPYWYAVWREGRRVHTRYVGKHLPLDLDLTGVSPREHAGRDTSAVSQHAACAEASLPALQRHNAEPAATGKAHRLRIWTLGQFRVERDGVSVPASAWRRQAAVTALKLLLLADHRRLPREHIAAHLWPDAEQGAARDHLAGAVHALRRALEPELRNGLRSRYLVQEGAMLTLRLGPEDWVDYLAFEAALARAEEAEESLPYLEAAMDLYGGDLLPEEQDVWCVAAREALRLRWHGVLLAVAEARVARRQIDSAAVALNRLLAADPTHEEAARRLMGLLARQGRRGEALRLYGGLVRALEDELAAEPAPETRSLAEALRLGMAPTHKRPVRLAPSIREPHLHRAASHLMGRDAEVARIRAALLGARDSRGGMLLLRGSTGVGKSRLADEAATVATMLGFATIVGRAAEGEQELPYAPIAEALRAYTRTRPQAALRRDLGGAEAVLGILPELAGSPYALDPPPPLEHPGAERLRLWTAVRTLLETATSTRPLLLVIEDLHWIDDASLGLLGFLLRRSRDLRLLLLATARDDAPLRPPLHALVHDGQRTGLLETIDLPPLAPEAVGELAQQQLGTTLTADEVAALHTQCGGNPLFVVELLALLRGQTAVDEAGAALKAVLAGERAIPATIRQILHEHLNRLSPTCRAVLQAGAVIGDHFQVGLLARIVDQDEGTVESTLAEATAVGLVRAPDGDGDGGYVLAHALLRQTLYGELPHTYRQRLHGRVGAALADGATGDRALEVIATHFAKSRDHLAASVWLERAGDYAATVYARGEARLRYAAARERLDRPGARAAGVAEAGAAVARLEEKLGTLCFLDGEHTAAQAHFACAREHARSAEERAELWRKEGMTWVRRGEFRQALAALDAAEREDGAGALPLALQAHLAVSRGEVYRSQGDHAAAEGAARQALDTLRDEPESTVVAQAAFLLGQIEAMRGNLADAEQYYRQSLAIRQRLGDRLGIAAAWHGLGMAAYDRGDAARAETCLQRSLAIREELGDQWGIAFSWNKLGQVAQFQGRYARAEECFHQALAIRERIGSQPDIARSVYALSQVAREQGEYGEAEARCLRGLRIQERIGDRWGIANSWLELGQVAYERGAFDEAASHLRRSLDLKEQLGDQLGVAHCLYALGATAIEQGDARGGYALCRGARRTAERIGARATAALATLGQAGAVLAQRLPRRAALLLRYSKNLAEGHSSARLEVFLALATAEQALAGGAVDVAEPAAREALRAAVQGRFRREEAMALRQLGRCAVTLGDLSAAKEALQASEALLALIGSAVEQARTRAALAGVHEYTQVG